MCTCDAEYTCVCMYVPQVGIKLVGIDSTRLSKMLI